MNKIQAIRMIKLSHYLEKLHLGKTNLDPVRFNLGEWRVDLEKWRESLIKNNELSDKMDFKNWLFIYYKQTVMPKCGTIACAIGHIPEALPNSKFKFTNHPDTGGSYLPSFNGVRGWKAVQIFFGIDENDAEDLFSYTSYDSPTEIMPVVKKLREFVSFNGYSPSLVKK